MNLSFGKAFFIAACGYGVACWAPAQASVRVEFSGTFSQCDELCAATPLAGLLGRDFSGAITIPDFLSDSIPDPSVSIFFAPPGPDSSFELHTGVDPFNVPDTQGVNVRVLENFASAPGIIEDSVDIGTAYPESTPGTQGYFNQLTLVARRTDGSNPDWLASDQYPSAQDLNGAEFARFRIQAWDNSDAFILAENVTYSISPVPLPLPIALFAPAAGILLARASCSRRERQGGAAG